MKNKFKENLGITLIALVVTIVVLLILAGISISMLTGQNGILNRASEAKEKTEKSQKDELDEITEIEAMVKTAGTKVSNPSSYGKNPNAQAIADGAGKYFALPDNATYLEGTVDTGAVVNIKGSEFVWVPVDDVVFDENRENELPKSDIGTDSEKKYTPMAVKVGDNYKGLLYDFDEGNSYLMYGNNVNYQGGSTDDRETDILSSYDGRDYDTVEDKITAKKLTKEYNAMIESVLKYKGFYVARYEAGLDKTTNEIVFKNASIEENNVTTTDASRSQTSSWYGLYKKIKTFATAENSEDKVISCMIWGSQYDAMMNWMTKTGKKIGTVDDYTKINNEKVTGKNPNDRINNIYDLYGSHYEWTLEACDTFGRAFRGGSSDYHFLLTNRISNDPISTYEYHSSRATLYIK